MAAQDLGAIVIAVGLMAGVVTMVVITLVRIITAQDAATDVLAVRQEDRPTHTWFPFPF